MKKMVVHEREVEQRGRIAEIHDLVYELIIDTVEEFRK